jgi:hypothetical protein
MSFLSVRLLSVAAILLAAVTVVEATPFFLNMPDFYQHQKAGNGGANPGVNIPSEPAPPDGQPGNTPSYDPAFPPNATTRGMPLWWEKNGGWCCIAAWADAMYYLDTQLGFNGLAIHEAGHTWQQNMTYITEDLALGVLGFAPTYPFRTIDKYMEKYLGVRASEINHVFFEWDTASSKVLKEGEESTFATMFDVVAFYISQGQAVNVRLDNGTGVWWDFHKVAVGGVDTANRTIYWADPDNTGHYDPGTGKWSGDKYAGAGWNHPYDSTDPFPVGQFFYQSGTLSNGRTFDKGSFYPGANMFLVEVFDALPEPSTFLITLTGLLAAVIWKRRGSAFR